jgi:hypothetical protein
MRAIDERTMRAAFADELDRLALRSAAVRELQAAGVISERRCLAEIERMWAQLQPTAPAHPTCWRNRDELA